MMKTKFKIFILLLLCLIMSGMSQAQTQHWQCNPYGWQYDMTAYVTVLNKSNPVSQLADYEIAAFCGDECRGVATVQTAEKDGNETVYGYLRIRSNQQSGETITFRVYDRQADKDVVLKGDVNGDGKITAQDASLVLQLVAKKIASTDDGIVYEAADVNDDGKVTAQDASLILQTVAKKITE